MAKSSRARSKIGLVCSECNSQNYVTERNKLNTKESLQLKKFCSKCRKQTLHKEKKKLH